MAYKILVVDDEKDVITALSHRLAREGYEVITASDGEEAILKVKSDNPDIILLDLSLPKKNGFEVLKEVREDYKDKWRPVIIISGRTELETVKQCYQLEADHYLTKPCTMEVVLRGIKTMISLIPARREV
jgi:two-component system, OmpR family, response regulator VicR